MHPADELAEIRDEIKRLRAREATLRAAFLQGEAPLRSNRFEVEVKTQTRRVFLRDRLPDEVSNDPRYWEERSSQIVRVVPLDRPRPANRKRTDDFDVLEDFED